QFMAQRMKKFLCVSLCLIEGCLKRFKRYFIDDPLVAESLRLQFHKQGNMLLFSLIRKYCANFRKPAFLMEIKVLRIIWRSDLRDKFIFQSWDNSRSLIIKKNIYKLLPQCSIPVLLITGIKPHFSVLAFFAVEPSKKLVDLF